MPRLQLEQASLRVARGRPLPEDSSEDSEFVAAAGRALTVLQAFDPSLASLSNTELAQRCGLPKSTISRLTYTLSRLGYLRLDATTQCYQLGAAVMALARTFLGARGVAVVARAHMEALATRFRAPAGLTERDGLEMLYVEYTRGDAPVIVPRSVGSRVPLAVSAAGRAWFASAHPVEAQAVRAQLQRHLGGAWKEARKGVDAAVQDLMQRGFTRSYGEMQVEVNSVAVPMRSPVDGTLMVFNLAAPAMLVPARRFDVELGPALVTMARQVHAEVLAAATGGAHEHRP